MIDVFMVAFGLAMDSFGVSIALGGKTSRTNFLSVGLSIGIVFALFHAVMLWGGYIFGSAFESFVSNVDHWIAFGLLFIVGARMIFSGQHTRIKMISTKNFDAKLIISLAFATSIDALVVGMGMSFFAFPIVLNVVAVTLVVFLLSLIGLFIGVEGNNLLHKKALVFGGIILIVIGVKILFEHLLS